jgi:hypothetical protein
MKRLLVLPLALVLLAPIAEAQRQRAVHSSAPPCSFSLSLAYADPVPDVGMVRGRIVLTPSAPTCTSWNAYSPVDWIVFEPGNPANEAAMTVKRNESTTARAATVRVAGLELNVTQQGKVEVPIIEVGVVKNGTFASDLANWGWQDRFPNGVGTVTWAAGIDANGSAASGSMRLRNTLLDGPGMQSLQCVSVEAGVVYNFSFAYRMQVSGSGLMQVSVFDLESADCTGPYFVRFTKQYFPNGTDAWRRDTNTFRLGGTARSSLIVFASKTQTNAAFDVYIDDVVMKLE